MALHVKSSRFHHHEVQSNKLCFNMQKVHLNLVYRLVLEVSYLPTLIMIVIM